MNALLNFNTTHKSTFISNRKNTPSFSGDARAKSECDFFTKSPQKSFSQAELQQKLLDLDFYKRDAKRMSKCTDIFTPKNLEKLSKLDFSGFKTKTEERHKYFLLYNLEKPEKVERFLKIIEPIKKEIYAEDLEYSSKNAINYIFELSKKPKEITLNQYFKLVQQTCGILEGPYDLLKERGFNETNIENFSEINKIIYGKQPQKQKAKLEQFAKDTGVCLQMDFNLPDENIEYVREFVNIEKASGSDVAPVIILTKHLDAYGSYCYGDFILCEPMVKADGTVCEEQLTTLQHENTHYLDEANINKTAKPKESYFYDKPNLKSIVSAFISTYSTKDRDEFVAEFRSYIQSNRMQKYADKNGEIHYRYPLDEKPDEKLEEFMKNSLKIIINLYYKFNGPKIKPSPLAEPSKKPENKDEHRFIDLTEKEILNH